MSCALILKKTVPRRDPASRDCRETPACEPGRPLSVGHRVRSYGTERRRQARSGSPAGNCGEDRSRKKEGRGGASGTVSQPARTEARAPEMTARQAPSLTENWRCLFMCVERRLVWRGLLVGKGLQGFARICIVRFDPYPCFGVSFSVLKVAFEDVDQPQIAVQIHT